MKRNVFGGFWPIDYPCALVAHDKHADSFWLARNESELLGAALAAVKMNDSCGYYDGIGDSLAPPEKPEFAQESIHDLPASLREVAGQVWSSYEAQMRIYRKHREQALLLREARKGSGRAAALLLMERRGYEYEGFEIVDLKIPETSE